MPPAIFLPSRALGRAGQLPAPGSPSRMSSSDQKVSHICSIVPTAFFGPQSHGRHTDLASRSISPARHRQLVAARSPCYERPPLVAVRSGGSLRVCEARARSLPQRLGIRATILSTRSCLQRPEAASTTAHQHGASLRDPHDARSRAIPVVRAARLLCTFATSISERSRS